MKKNEKKFIFFLVIKKKVLLLQRLLRKDSLAQSVEQRPFKPWVLRSNRRRVTKKPLKMRGFFYVYMLGNGGIF